MQVTFASMNSKPATLLFNQPRFRVTVFFFISGILAASWSSRIPSVQQSLSMNDAEWGALLFCSPLGLLTGMLFSGYVIEKFGAKFIIIGSGIAYCLALMLLGISAQAWHLVVALFLFGFTRNFFNMAVNTHSVEVQKLYTKPIISTLHGIWSVSCIAAAAVGTVMIANDISTGYHFIAVAAVCMIIILSYSGFGKKQIKAHAHATKFFVKPDKQLLLMGGICFTAMLCEGAMFDWSVNYFEQVVKAPKTTVTAGYTCFIITMATGRLLGDKLIACFGAMKLLLANGVIMAAGFLIAALFPFFTPACIGFLLVGIGDAILVPLLYSLAGQSKKMAPSYAIASVTILGYIGFLIGPVLLGSISHSLNMQWSFGLLSVLSVSITIITWYLRKII